MELTIDKQLSKNFPDLNIIITKIGDIIVKKNDINLENYKKEVLNEISKKYSLASLKDETIFRKYRDFFWRIGIDPTKTRPAAEALIRRVIAGRTIPEINNLVDTYNLTSIKTGIALAAFDHSKLMKKILARFAEPNEEFFGIGMKAPQILKGNEVIITDEEKKLLLYIHIEIQTKQK